MHGGSNDVNKAHHQATQAMVQCEQQMSALVKTVEKLQEKRHFKVVISAICTTANSTINPRIRAANAKWKRHSVDKHWTFVNHEDITESHLSDGLHLNRLG